MIGRLVPWASLCLLGVACAADGQTIALRSQPQALTEAQVLQMIADRGFACPAKDIRGTFVQRYQSAALGDDRVVTEQVTNLMWQQAESPRLDWRELQAYLTKVNQARYAGFSDWRIPTVEELASLLESRQTGEVYLDAVFAKDDLLSTWTADEAPGIVGGAWFVSFTEGAVSVGNRLAGLGNSRLVRTLSPSR